MSPDESRQKDILLMLFAIQLSLVAVLYPELYPLLLVSVLIFAAVLVEETRRRLDEYSG